MSGIAQIGNTDGTLNISPGNPSTGPDVTINTNGIATLAGNNDFSGSCAFTSALLVEGQLDVDAQVQADSFNTTAPTSPTSISPTSGTPFQPNSTKDVELCVSVSLSATASASAQLSISLGPSGSEVSLGNGGVVFSIPKALSGDQFLVSLAFRVPAGWYVTATVTNVGTVGLTAFYWG
jgi:hypothetical protein